MIQCGDCGQINDPGDLFCGSCSAFLEYVGTPVVDPQADTGSAVPLTETAPTIASPTVPPPFAGQTATPPPFGPPPYAPSLGAPPPYPGPSATPATAPPPYAAEPSPAPETDRPRRWTVAATRPKQVADPSPVGVQSTAAEPIATGIEDDPGATNRPPPPVKPSPKPVKRALRPGELICGRCGAGNPPERNFCRDCGNTLAEAEVVPPLPWWRRLFARSPKPAPKAGDRRGREGPSGSKGKARARLRRLPAIGAALMAIALVAGSFMPGSNPIKSVKKDLTAKVRSMFTPEFEQVFPISATATSSDGAATPDLVIDGAKNTWWAEGVEGLGVGETITITFSNPTDLAKVGVTPGTTREQTQFLLQPRPKSLFLSFSDGSTETIKLTDSVDFQSFEVEARSVTTVNVQILDAYPSMQGQSTAIAEIEFYVEQS